MIINAIPMVNSHANFSKNRKIANKQNVVNISFKGANDKPVESLWETSKKNIEIAADKLGLSNEVKNKILYPERKIAGNIFIKGVEEPIEVFRVQHNTVLGPGKGGIRALADLTFDDVVGLAADMSMKNSLAGLPLGGGKGGIKYDLSKLNPEQRVELFEEYTKFLFPNIGPKLDVPAPDMNTNANDMHTIQKAYSKLLGREELAVVTGKPVGLGGSLGRNEATGFGVVQTIQEAFQKMGINQRQATAAVQGSGNVGGMAARFLHEDGVKVVGMSDMYGGIYNPKGLDVPKVLEEVKTKGTLTKYANAEKISNADLLALDVDVLVPAARQGQITEKNAANVMAKIVAEGANGPTTSGADVILSKRGVHVIPDILANQGGVVGSYYEFVQNIKKESWTLDAYLKKLSQHMKSRYNAVFDFAQNNKVGMRDATSMISVDNIAKALKKGIKV